MAYTREEIEVAKTMVACPYYTHEGVCVSGCWHEPACIVDTPHEGWEAIVEAGEQQRPADESTRR